MRTPKQDAWMNPDFEGRKLGKTAILATAGSEARALQFEQYLASQLTPYTEATSMHATHDLPGKIDKEVLEALLKDTGIKTLIITRVIDEASRDELVTIGYGTSPQTGDYWNHYSWGYEIYANQATVTSYMEYIIDTTIYDVETVMMVWNGRKNVFDDRSSTENMQIVINEVMRDLKKENML
jgi:hypothetical protein